MEKSWTKVQRNRFLLPAAFVGLYLLALLVSGQYQERTSLYYVLTLFGFGLLVCAQTIYALAFYWKDTVKQALFAIAISSFLLPAAFFCIGFLLPKTQIRTDDLSYVVERVQTSSVFLLSYLRFALLPAVICAVAVCCRGAIEKFSQNPSP